MMTMMIVDQQDSAERSPPAQEDDPQVLRSYRHRLLLLYTLDLVGMVGISVASFVIEKLRPIQRPIRIDDPTINLPFAKHELVPWWTLPLISLAAPSVIIGCFWASRRFQPRRLFVAFCGVALCVSLTYLITSILKVTVGRLRPDFLDRCRPDPAALPKIVCLGKEAFVDEGRRSFPSGHTSLSFAGLGFVSLFLAGQFCLFHRHGAVLISGLVLLVLAPLIGAGLVGLSRIIDNRHHWQDVLVGALIGITLAYGIYRIYFGPISSPDSPIPNPSRFDAVYAKCTASKTSSTRPLIVAQADHQQDGQTSHSPLKQYSPSPPPNIRNI